MCNVGDFLYKYGTSSEPYKIDNLTLFGSGEIDVGKYHNFSFLPDAATYFSEIVEDLKYCASANAGAASAFVSTFWLADADSELCPFCGQYTKPTRHWHSGNWHKICHKCGRKLSEDRKE